MQYTKEEIELMKANTKQIIGYLETLRPRLRETVTITFGDTAVRRGDYGFPVREPEFEIHVGMKCMCGHSGGLRIDFSGEERSSYAVSIYSSGFGVEYMAKLIRDWHMIKSKLISAIDRQEEDVLSLHNFSL